MDVSLAKNVYTNVSFRLHVSRIHNFFYVFSFTADSARRPRPHKPPTKDIDKLIIEKKKKLKISSKVDHFGIRERLQGRGRIYIM